MKIHTLAQQLNTILSGSVIEKLLSEFGKRIYFPKGVAAQTKEAADRAFSLNATVGIATKGGDPLTFSMVRKNVRKFSNREIVDYAPNAGVRKLRELWKQEILDKNPLLNTLISMPIVAAGLTHGLMMMSDLLVDKGDIVVMPDLIWGNYNLIFHERVEGTIVTFPFFNADGNFNVTAFEEVLKKHGKKSNKLIIVLNFPNNPTGYNLYEHEVPPLLKAIERQAERGCSIAVINDDAYFGLSHRDGIYQNSLFTPLANLHERVLAVKIDGATKEEFSWGLRVGFVTVGGKGLEAHHYEAFNAKITGTLRCTVSNCSMIGQNLVLKMLMSSSHSDEKKKLHMELTERFRRMTQLIHSYTDTNLRLLTPLPFNSGYFMCFRCHGIDAEQLRQRLLDKGYGVVALNDPAGGSYIRVAYSSVDLKSIAQLLEQMYLHAGHMITHR